MEQIATNRPVISMRMILAALAFTAAVASGCAVPQHRDSVETLRIGKAGLAVLVDSSVRVAVAGQPDSVSIPENAMIGVEMLQAVESGLGQKGYVRSGPSLISVGAPFKATEKLQVQTVGGVWESPGNIGKPFIIRPTPSDPAVSAKVNALFLWAKKAGVPAPQASLDVFRASGLMLVACAGGNKQDVPAGAAGTTSVGSFNPGNGPAADAWSEVTVLLLDSASGNITWLERGTVSAFTPEAVAKEVTRLVAELPAAK